ncbi:hypothetical protein SPRG_00760 [Saprolegnia parasitica CBS 223.65]|uniref:Uncharacterized protein n=1 Tax=Saprolegnia parasitica (strain CBS 223.65) TaxID=695850 RepID=A0A067D6T4_SAPPC|nr:hypothetical protein SPRG_00760 [Saprolegnia parasitica CBS 223.65]KDO34697.1 hypothetical protein SPRG_00760 [Saprolegnia parasitica CBS 223.65]|eukprot:XP_012194368.1 hypothetical protein SPRG_00760 [Saprolegnia parasitica CBS 223.65]
MADSRATDGAVNRSHVRWHILRMVLVDFAAPVVIYSIASSYTNDVVALLLSAIPPALNSVLVMVQRRSLDPISCLVVVSIALSAALAAITSDAKLLLVKDSFLTFVFGLAFLFSVGCGTENLIWRYYRQMAGPDATSHLDALYASAIVRTSTNLMCYVWGAGLVVEALLRLVLIYLLPIHTMAYISPTLIVLTLASLGYWNAWYAKRLRRQYEGQDVPMDTKNARSYNTSVSSDDVA